MEVEGRDTDSNAMEVERRDSVEHSSNGFESNVS